MTKNRSNSRRRTGMSANVHRMHTYMNRSIKVPQKGKVRIFLVILLIAAAGKNVLSFVAEAVAPTPEQKLAAMIKKATKRELREQKERERLARAGVHVDQLPVSTKAKGLTYEELLISMAQFPPTLQAEKDTVQWKNHQIIRYFTLDTALQAIGNSLMKKNHPKAAAMVVLQPQTGRILSLTSFNNPKEEEQFGENLFFKANLPAASIFKTVTAAAAIEKNALTPDYVFPLNGNAHTLYKNQIVKDIKASYTLTFADAYAYSVNPIFGRLGLYYAGINTLQEYAQKFGFNDSIPFELPIEISRFTPETDTFAIAELASGYNKKTTMSPMLGALIAGGIANGGRVYRPTIVDSVVELVGGKKVYEAEPQPWRVLMSEKGAAALKGMMQVTTAKGTARKGFATIKGMRVFDQFQHGGKTGNINTDPKIVKGRVEWFIGFLKDPNLSDENLSCAVLQLHGNIWNVHSSFLAGEMLRFGVKGIQEKKKELASPKVDSTEVNSQTAAPNSSVSKPK